MNIYIYGSNLFKQEMFHILQDENIREKLDEINDTDELYGHIVDIVVLDELKNTVIKHSNSIFLIDEAKIIQNNIFTKYFKFYNASDGIERSFLEEYETSIKVEVDDVGNIAQYILDRLDTYNTDTLMSIEEIKDNNNVSNISDI